MSFGKPYILKTGGCIHDGWLVLEGVEKRFDNLFLYELLASEGLLRKFSSLARGGVVNNLNKDLVASVSVMVPPVDMQQEFSDFVRQVDKSKFAVQKALDELNATTKKILNQELGLGDV